MLIHNRLKPLSVSIESNVEPHDINTFPNSNSNDYGCFKCNATRCNVCKWYLKEGITFTSYHTDQIFSFKSRLHCKEEGVIYLINDLKCQRSSVGKTMSNICVRWRNHKSYIKQNLRSCAITLHYSNCHILDRNDYDKSLSDHIEVQVIEKVDFKGENDDSKRQEILGTREAYWQGQLKTMEIHGGLNKRDENSSRPGRNSHLT